MSAEGQDRRAQVVRLYRELGPIVYRRCVRLLRDREAARDATQEVFLRLLRQEELLDDDRHALRWIYSVATHHCLNLQRERRSRARAVAAAAGAGPEAGGPPERRLAQQVLGRFDPTTQAVAVGVLVDGMEREEVAGVLGVSRRTVHRRLARFLEGARWLLQGERP